jgi:SAM-dependent methyltransferase
MQEFVYAQCLRCGIIILTNQPISEDLGKIYPKDYSGWKSRNKIMGHLRSRNFQRLYKDMKKHSQARYVLDYGCGNGEFLKSLDKENLNLVGFDFTLDQAEQSDQRINYVDNFEKVLSMDKFDHIYLLQVIEHLPDPVETMRELSSRLTNNGIIIIQTPVREGWDYKIVDTELWGGWHAPRHFHIWSQGHIEQLAQILDLRILEIKYIPSPFLWAETLRVKITQKRFQKYISSDKLLFTAFAYALDIFQLRLRRKTSNIHVVLGRNLPDQ